MMQMSSQIGQRALNGGHGLACRPASRAAPARRLASLAVRATKTDEKQEVQRKKVLALEESMKKSGLDKQRAMQVLKAWEDTVAGGGGKPLTAEDLRRVLVKQGAKFSALIFVQIFLDLGAAYGAYVGGTFLGAGQEQYGGLAVALQAGAFFVSGYYGFGAFLDVFRLLTVLTATYQFNVNAGSFLEAVRDVAGASPSGLGAVDKAVEAVNTLKVLGSLSKMADLLKEQQQGSGEASSGDMLQDLATYLTLEKAQRLYEFDAARYGISDELAAAIATVFSAFDSDANGVLSLDEFTRLCAKYAPELSGEEVKAALEVLDTNKDGNIQLGEFVEWWVATGGPSASASA